MIAVPRRGWGSSPIVVETERFRLEYTRRRPPPRREHECAGRARPAPAGCADGGRARGLDAQRKCPPTLGHARRSTACAAPCRSATACWRATGGALVDDSQTALAGGRLGRGARQHEGPEHNTDWYLFAYGSDYRAAARALATIAGGVPLPRRCAWDRGSAGIGRTPPPSSAASLMVSGARLPARRDGA